MTELPLEDTDKYKWMNETAAETGLHQSVLAELYLQGWVLKSEPYVYEDEKGVPHDATRVILWKDNK